MVAPNFFIVGAPKCGTSALYAYLREHPDVFLPRVKEPHFFCRDFPGLRRFPSEAEYLRLFQDAANGQRVGEATSRYLYSEEAVAEIERFCPQAQYIVMLRNPVDLVHSLHGQLVYQYSEDVLDVEEAWQLQDTRREGKRIPPSCPSVSELLYGDVARLGFQMRRLFDTVPEDRVHVILYDDFCHDLPQVYSETLRFLGLRQDGRSAFPRVNPAKTYRSALLARLMFDPPFPLDVVKARLKQSFGWKETSVGRWLYARMTVPQKLPPLSASFRNVLQAYFAEDVAALEEILQRDLSNWAAPATTSAKSTTHGKEVMS